MPVPLLAVSFFSTWKSSKASPSSFWKKMPSVTSRGAVSVICKPHTKSDCVASPTLMRAANTIGVPAARIRAGQNRPEDVRKVPIQEPGIKGHRLLDAERIPRTLDGSQAELFSFHDCSFRPYPGFRLGRQLQG